MKTITKITALLIVPLLYCFLFAGLNSGTAVSTAGLLKTTSPPPPEGGDKDFVNAIFNCGIENVNNRNRWVTGQIDRYRDTLNFNSIQIYDFINGSVNGTADYGEFLANLNEETQVPNITTLKNMVYGENLKLYWERCKISKLCYGQRLVYEVSDGGSTTVNNGFCYQNTSGCYETDQNRTVLHLSPNSIPNCSEQDATPRFIAYNIYENLQHGDLTQFNLQFADLGLWYVKPMMRIDSNIVDNYPEIPVVKIVVNNFQGDTIKNIIIKAKHFAQNLGGTIYGGQYIDVYNYIQDPQFNLEVSGDTTLNGNGLNDGVNWTPEYQWDDSCHVDFKVYWSGQVEVWFDKMTVDDRIGNGLFDGTYDYHILDETTPDMFFLTSLMVKDRRFAESNYDAVNYVMNVMYNHLRNCATPYAPYVLNNK